MADITTNGEKENDQLSWHGEVNVDNYTEMVERYALYRTQRLNVLKLVVEILEKEGINYWLDCGSLLGAYRNGKMIPHDSDTDVSILGDEEFDRARKALRQNLSDVYSMDDGTSYAEKIMISQDSCGTCKFSDDVECSNVTGDVNKYILRQDGTLQQLYYKFNLGERRYQHDWVFPLGKMQFEGLTLPCPNNVKAYLEEMYGYLGTDFKYDPVSTRFVKRD
ncbi:uncharacterized protein RP689-like [Sycon ciliatum]|uniref:uncharacterized protein RP689-like n=1 Tax=Sycon ciliatum TaxID=27933 RepID=UPI0020AD713F|eukprot:scpid80054/ scgid29797/ 